MNDEIIDMCENLVFHLKELKEYERRMLLDKYFKDMIEEKGFFTIPHMVVHRDDLVAIKEGHDDFEKWKEKCYALSDDKMDIIASKIGKGLMIGWSDVVDEVVRSIDDE